MQYELKPCRDEDREWAYALKSEAYREVVERQFGRWDEPFQWELFCARWSPAISRVILIDGVRVGILALEERTGELWLAEIQLVRAWRGRGIGSMLIRELLARARAARKKLRLQVLKENHRAQNLYGRLGLGVTGETRTHFLMEDQNASPQPSHGAIINQT